MIRMQVSDQEPVEVTEVAEVLECLQKHIRFGVPYAINILDDQEGTLIVVAEIDTDKDHRLSRQDRT